MRVRELERVLVDMGVPASFLDQITRRLREMGLLPVRGRGVNAAQIGAAEVALVLLAMGGTDTAAQAANAIVRQMHLRMPSGAFRRAPDFHDALQLLVSDPEWAEEVDEIRFGRTHALSQIIYNDGTVERFVGPEADSLLDGGTERFRTEGIIGGRLLHEVARVLASEPIGASA